MNKEILSNFKSLYLLKILIILLVGIILIYYYWPDISPLLEEILGSIQKIRPGYVILAFLLYLLSAYIFAERWKNVLSNLGYDLKTSYLVPIIFGGIAMNNLTPANRTGGEPLRLFWLNRQYGVPYSQALASILFERLVEAIPIMILFIYAVSSLSIISSPAFQSPFIQKVTQYLNIIHYLIFFGLLMFFMLYLLRGTLRPYAKKLYAYQKQFHRSFIPVLLLSSAVWVLDVLRLKLITISLSLDIPLKLIAAISILYLVLGSIPLTPGGIGVVEGGLISILTFFGIPLSAAGSIVLIERFISYFLSSMIGAFYLFYYGVFKIWKNAKSH